MLDSILTQADDAVIKGRRRYRVMQTCGVVCSLIAIVFIFALPPFLQNTIISQSIDKVVMTHENEGQWAHFPGDTRTVIIRNFTFHRLMNEDDFLLRHQKPKFQEIADFKIQELEDFLDIEYSEDSSKVKVKDWLRFGEWTESRDLDTVVNILNMGNLGYWATFKAARPTLILQQGLALLFTNMEQSIVSVLIGTGINSQFLPNKTSAVNALLLPAGVEAENIDFLWTDLSYGLNSP